MSCSYCASTSEGRQSWHLGGISRYNKQSLVLLHSGNLFPLLFWYSITSSHILSINCLCSKLVTSANWKSINCQLSSITCPSLKHFPKLYLISLLECKSFLLRWSHINPILCIFTHKSYTKVYLHMGKFFIILPNSRSNSQMKGWHLWFSSLRKCFRISHNGLKDFLKFRLSESSFSFLIQAVLYFLDSIFCIPC